jgi:hypothetical protein
MASLIAGSGPTAANPIASVGRAPGARILTETIADYGGGSKSVYPKITPVEVARALATSASYHPHGGYNTTVGFGLINPAGALHAAGSLLKLRTTAAAGPAVVNPGSRLARSSVPGIVDAVHHAPARLAVLSAVIVAGLAVLLLALWLARRWRRASPRAPRTAP